MSPDPAGVSTSASGLTPPLRPEHLPTLTKGMDMQQNQKTVITVVGARPQFVKAGPVSRALQQEGLREIIVHTGQHYDEGMSDVFFRELGIPAPGYHLGAGGGSHGAMTGRMLEKIEEVLLKEQPDALLVYGDTNSTLAGALAAAAATVATLIASALGVHAMSISLRSGKQISELETLPEAGALEQQGLPESVVA